MIRRPVLCAVLLCLLSFPSARADELLLKNGRVVEGHIIEETTEHYVVRTRFGKKRIKRSDVAQVTRGPTRREVFEKRFEEAASADAFVELAAWAEGQELKKEARRALLEAVRLDPVHEAAQTRLGRVLHEGRWVTPAEKERLLRDKEAAAMEAAGLVRREGRWVTREEAEALEAGLVLHEGRWVTPEVRGRALGLVERDGKWIEPPRALARDHADEVVRAVGQAKGAVPLERVETRHFLVLGPYDRQTLVDVAALLENARDWIGKRLGPGQESVDLVCLFERDGPYGVTVDLLEGRTPWVGKAWAASARQSHGAWIFDPVGQAAVVRRGRPEADAIGEAVHLAGHIQVARRGYKGVVLPAWYAEAWAALCEAAVTGRNAVFCKAPGRYASHHDDRGLFEAGDWRQSLRKVVDGPGWLPLTRLLLADYRDLTRTAIAEAMAFVEFAEVQGAVKTLHEAVRRCYPGPDPGVGGSRRRAANEQMLRDAMGAGLVTVEGKWREWLLRPPAEGEQE